MENLSFDNGIIEVMINGDKNKTIAFCPSDINISVRYKEALKIFEELSEKVKNIFNDKSNDTEAIFKQIEEYKKIDDTVKKTIDYIFNAEISNIVFGELSSLSKTSNGSYAFENLLNSLLGLCNKCYDNKVSHIKNGEKAQKYLSKYNRRRR